MCLRHSHALKSVLERRQGALEALCETERSNPDVLCRANFPCSFETKTMETFIIKTDDLSSPKIAELLAEHLRDMYEQSPPGSVHALDLDDLRKPGIAFWSVWSGDDLVGCGALKELDETHGEIKSMRTANKFRGKGAGKLMLRHITDEARSRGYKRLSLETGSMAFFDPARRLYESYGFRYCGPFADYVLDPNSVFMTVEL